MHIEVVAEGIETVEQLDVLRACGVELVQGFLFSKPIPIGEYEKKYL
ncbi:MAG: EAL domain-containing protein [Emergencia timonensis]